MRKSELAELFARRLGAPPGRITSILQRATEAGLLPKASGSDRPVLSRRDIATALIAVVADEGLGSVARAVSRYGSMRCARIGETLENALANLLDADDLHVLSQTTLVVFKDERAPAALITGITSDGAQHAVFVHGDPANAAASIKGATTSVRVDGTALAGIAMELAGEEHTKVDVALKASREARWRLATSATGWSRDHAAALFGEPR